MKTKTKQTSAEFFKSHWGECWKEAKEALGNSTYEELSNHQYKSYIIKYNNYFKPQTKPCNTIQQ